MTVWKIGDRIDTVRPAGEPGARSPADRRRWSLVNVNVSRETTTEQRIQELGYLTYVPKFATEVWDRRRHRRKVNVERPLFPGYLFAKFNPDLDPWGSIEATPGVIRIVRMGEQPSPVPDMLVAHLQAAESDNHVERRAPSLRKYRAGDELVVLYGPFAELIVRFVRCARDLDDTARIVALLDLLGRKVKIELEPDQVARP